MRIPSRKKETNLRVLNIFCFKLFCLLMWMLLYFQMNLTYFCPERLKFGLALNCQQPAIEAKIQICF